MRKLTIVFVLLLAGCQSMTADYHDRLKEKERKLTSAKINVRLGMAYLERNDVDRAKQKFLFALQNAPDLSEAWYAMGYFQEATHQYKAANHSYLKAIALAPTSGEAHNNYGTFLCRMEDYPPALEQFDLAVQDPKYLYTAAAFENAGLCALKAKNIKVAKAYFEKAIDHDPNSSIAERKLNYINSKYFA